MSVSISVSPSDVAAPVWGALRTVLAHAIAAHLGQDGPAVRRVDVPGYPDISVTIVPCTWGTGALNIAMATDDYADSLQLGLDIVRHAVASEGGCVLSGAERASRMVVGLFAAGHARAQLLTA